MTVFETVAFNHSATCPCFAPISQGTNNLTRFRQLCQPPPPNFRFAAPLKTKTARDFSVICYRAPFFPKLSWPRRLQLAVPHRSHFH